jgi:hypothetical protein
MRIQHHRQPPSAVPEQTTADSRDQPLSASTTVHSHSYEVVHVHLYADSWRAATVLFEVELSLEALVDRLDDLPQRLEQFSSGTLRLTLAGRPQQPEVQLGQLVLEVTAEVVLVADQRLSGPGGDQLRFGSEQVQQRLALVGLGPGQGELTLFSGSKDPWRLKMSAFAQVNRRWITR